MNLWSATYYILSETTGCQTNDNSLLTELIFQRVPTAIYQKVFAPSVGSGQPANTCCLGRRPDTIPSAVSLNIFMLLSL